MPFFQWPSSFPSSPYSRCLYSFLTLVPGALTPTDYKHALLWKTLKFPYLTTPSINRWNSHGDTKPFLYTHLYLKSLNPPLLPLAHIPYSLDRNSKVLLVAFLQYHILETTSTMYLFLQIHKWYIQISLSLTLQGKHLIDTSFTTHHDTLFLSSLILSVCHNHFIHHTPTPLNRYTRQTYISVIWTFTLVPLAFTQWHCIFMPPILRWHTLSLTNNENPYYTNKNIATSILEEASCNQLILLLC